MITPLAEMREQRELAVNELKQLADLAEKEARSFTQEELTRYDELDAEQENLKAQIETLARADRARALTQPTTQVAAPAIVRSHKRQATKADYNNALRAFLGHGQATTIRDEWKRSADLVGINYQAKEIIVRAQSSDVDAAGGNLDNDSVYAGLVQAKQAFGGMESVSHVLQTGDGAPIHFATVDDTATAAVVSAQNQTVANAGFTFGKVSLGIYSYKTATYPVSLELLQDAQFDVGSFMVLSWAAGLPAL